MTDGQLAWLVLGIATGAFMLADLAQRRVRQLYRARSRPEVPVATQEGRSRGAGEDAPYDWASDAWWRQAVSVRKVRR